MPGMHQIVENKHVNFDAIVAKMAGVQPMTTFPMMGWGKKSFIRATLQRKTGVKVEIEFFTELTFPSVPPNQDIGYVPEDSTLYQGVQILDFEKTTDTDGYRPNQGEIMAYTDFADRYIHETSTRITLDRLMEDMADLLVVNEQSIERINNAWCNRDPGNQELYSVQYQ